MRGHVRRAHWAGMETPVRYNGYMEGVVRSRESAAREVLDGLVE